MHASIHRAAFAVLAGLLSSPLLSPVGAQTPPRYTLRELPRPAGAQYCAAGSLNEAGDAALYCTYKGGTRSEADFFCVPYIFCLPINVTRAWFYNVPALFKADGTQRVLATADLTNAFSVQLTNAGIVHATVQPLDANGRPGLGPDRQLVWRPVSNQPEPLPPLVVDGENFFVLHVRASGRILWHTWDSKRYLLTAPDGRIEPLPEVPPELGPFDGETGISINDNGMVLRQTWLKGSPTPDNPYANPIPHSMFFDGQKWMRVKMPPVGSMGGGSQSLNAKGQYVARDVRLTRYFWQPAQPDVLATLPGGGGLSGETLVINDAGIIGGGIPIAGDRNARSKATIWIGGQPVDLNTLTANLPRGWQLQTVKAINNKGQLLVNALDTTRASSADAAKAVLLTPQ